MGSDMIIVKETNQELENNEFDFGQRKQNSSVSTTFIVKGENIKNLQAVSDCSCTSVTPTQKDKNTAEINIIYKATNTLHNINRTVQLTYLDNDEPQVVNIKLIGQIIN